MPEKQTVERAKEDLREGKAPSTAAGEFVREEIEHVREGKHGARSPQQAIAIGLSKARRAGIPLKPPARGKAKETTRKSAERDYRKGQSKAKTKRPRRKASRTREEVLEREPRNTASHKALSKQARSAARRRKPSARSQSARRASRTRKAA
ncbi:MAG TPA: DNA-binding protein [Terriglobales bacterium]|nr:DNA-binding protein [Terriglobales bacterium]